MGAFDGIDEAGLQRVVARFYARVRADDQLGAVFNDAIDDWPAHLENLAAFWSSVMLRTGRYKGNPMAAHLRHRARITPAMFGRWLALWDEVVSETLPRDAATALRGKAARIAERLQFALALRPASAQPAGRVPA